MQGPVHDGTEAGETALAFREPVRLSRTGAGSAAGCRGMVFARSFTVKFSTQGGEGMPHGAT